MDFELERKPVDAHVKRVQGILFVGLDEKPAVKQPKSLAGQLDLFGETENGSGKKNDGSSEN